MGHACTSPVQGSCCGCHVEDKGADGGGIGCHVEEPVVGALVPRQEKVPRQSEVEEAGTPDSCPDNLDSGAILEELMTVEVPGVQQVEAVQEAEYWCETPEADNELCAPDSGPRAKE
jgi:hypothetical protein